MGLVGFGPSCPVPVMAAFELTMMLLFYQTGLHLSLSFSNDQNLKTWKGRVK